MNAGAIAFGKNVFPTRRAFVAAGIDEVIDAGIEFRMV